MLIFIIDIIDILYLYILYIIDILYFYILYIIDILIMTYLIFLFDYYLRCFKGKIDFNK